MRINDEDVWRPIECLDKMQSLRELMCLFQTYVSPQKEVMDEILQKAECQLNDLPLSFEIVLNNKNAVNDRLTNLMPVIWQFTMTSGSDEVKVSSCYQLAVDPPEPNLNVISSKSYRWSILIPF